MGSWARLTTSRRLTMLAFMALFQVCSLFYLLYALPLTVLYLLNALPWTVHSSHIVLFVGT